MVTGNKNELRCFIDLYLKASVKFVWEFQDVESYIPVIEKAIQETYKCFALWEREISQTDIGSMIGVDKDGRKLYFALYINNRKYHEMGTIYSIFKGKFKVVAQGYDEIFGFKFPMTNLERFIEVHEKITGVSQEQLTQFWEETQKLKRKITNFLTLANKSLNRKRRVTPKLRFEILQRDHFRCVLCGRTAHETKLHVDHFIPITKSGGNHKDNLVTLCEECNLGKGTSIVDIRELFLID